VRRAGAGIRWQVTSKGHGYGFENHTRTTRLLCSDR
jgi:hypothetical protein